MATLAKRPSCTHPLVARAVEAYAVGPRAADRRLRTVCWACKVEAEVRP